MPDRTSASTRSTLALLAPHTFVPILAVIALVLALGVDLPFAAEIPLIVLLGGSVLAAVHHAEVIALRVGEPFGSLILAVAVTVIEVGLIVAIVTSGGAGSETLARDTVFAAVMITCNGIVGLSLLLAALRKGVAVFNAEGTGAALATVLALATLSLVLPRFTTSEPGPEFSEPQLVFAAVFSLILYGLFVFVQNVKHRDYFLPPVGPAVSGTAKMAGRSARPPGDQDERAPKPTRGDTTISMVLLLVSLLAVVGLGKVESETIEDVVRAAGLPSAVVGVAIAVLILLPETLAAARNARRDRAQISLNLALGSAMASIGLTIPTMAVVSIALDIPLVLGLGPIQIVLLALTAVVGILTVMPGRSTTLQATVHLSICAAFLFLTAVP